ncbi:MAG: transposase [Gemmataceae bacterium]
MPKTANATVNKVENLSDLFSDHLKLVIPIRRNRKNRLVPLAEKLLLRKRSLIETINDQLKNASQLCHIRHRSPLNAVVHLVAGLVCYQHQPNNSKLRLSESEQEILRGALPGGEPLIIRMDEDGSGQTITGP